MSKIILLSGMFHKQKHEIDKFQTEIRIPLVPEIKLMDSSKLKDFNFDEVKYEKYIRIIAMASFFSSIVPENWFLHENINPHIFLKNLILDYVK